MNAGISSHTAPLIDLPVKNIDVKTIKKASPIKLLLTARARRRLIASSSLPVIASSSVLPEA